MRRTHHRSILALAALLASGSAVAAQSRVDAMLRRLEPDTRLEQVCDIEALKRIREDDSPHRPDRVVGSALTPASQDGHHLVSAGAAFRSQGRWYRLDFDCAATDDNMRVVRFEYRIGDEIPEERWSDLGLWR